jgi:hypothetical protein
MITTQDMKRPKSEYAEVQLTAKFKADLREYLKTHTMVELAEKLNTTTSAISWVLKPTTNASSLVIPICKLTGITRPVTTDNERLERWAMVAQKFDAHDDRKSLEMLEELERIAESFDRLAWILRPKK